MRLMKQKIIYVLGALILGIIALLYITNENGNENGNGNGNGNGNDANMKVKIITEAAKKEGSKTFSTEELANIMDASRESGVNPAWIAGMTKAESGGKCDSRAFNNNYLKRATKKFGEDYQALVDAGLVKGKHHGGKKKDKAGNVLRNADGSIQRTCYNCKTYNDQRLGDQSYFDRAYKIAPKSAVYVTAWGTNQVMGWELLRLGGVCKKQRGCIPVPGSSPDKIVEEFFNDPCGVSTKLFPSWAKYTAGPAWTKRANNAVATGNISDWKYTTRTYLGSSNSTYRNRIIRNAKAFQQEHPKLVEEFGGKVTPAKQKQETPLEQDLRIQRARYPAEDIQTRNNMKGWRRFPDRQSWDIKNAPGFLDSPIDFEDPTCYDFSGFPVSPFPEHCEPPDEALIHTPGEQPLKKAQQKRPTPGKDLAGQTIILIGDSQMEYGTMGRQLEKMLAGRGAHVHRFARGASGVEFWALTLQGIRHKRLSKPKTRKWTSEYLKSLNPNQIIVSLGGNDSWRGNFGKNKKTMEDYLRDWAPIAMEQLKDAFDEGTTPDITWFGPGHRWTSGVAGWRGKGKRRKHLTKERRQEQLRRGRDETNRILKEIAGEEGIKYVSMLNWVNDDERLEGLTPKEIRWDGIHYRGVMAGYYAEAIASKVGTPGEEPTKPLKEPVKEPIEEPIEEPPEKTPLSKKISVDFKDSDIRDIFGFLGEMTGITIFVNKDISKNITLELKEVTVKEAFEQIVKLASLKYKITPEGKIYVGDPPYINYAIQKKPIKGRRGRFVHGLKRVNFPKFDFDTFYEQLDTYFSECEPNQDCITSPKLECCGRQIMLPVRGTDYKFGREHHAAWKKLQEAKTEKKYYTPGAPATTRLKQEPYELGQEEVPIVPTEEIFLKERKKMKTKTIINVHSRNDSLKEGKKRVLKKGAELADDVLEKIPLWNRFKKWFKIAFVVLAYDASTEIIKKFAPETYNNWGKYLDTDHFTDYFTRLYGISHIPPFSYLTGDEEPNPAGTFLGTNPELQRQILEKAKAMQNAMDKLDGARKNNDDDLLTLLGEEIFTNYQEIKKLWRDKVGDPLKCIKPPVGYGKGVSFEKYGIEEGQVPFITDRGRIGNPEHDMRLAIFNRFMYLSMENIRKGKPVSPEQCDYLQLAVYGPDEVYTEEK
jgi:lysophospholipase L1-like esterase